MNRRNFNLLAGTSLLAAMCGQRSAMAAAPDAGLLTTTLTPMGSERAGNAAGTIPAWTGGMTEIPAGFDWDPEKTLPPDFFADDAMLYQVDASNLAQYAHLLSDGVQALIKRQGFYVKVYPTHRTQAMPQWVYDNIAQNVTRSAAAKNGDYLYGFTGAYGGYPFPIPASDPASAAEQIMWNNEAHWWGPYTHQTTAAYTTANGQPILTEGARIVYRNDLYLPGGNPQSFSGYFYWTALDEFAPATSAGDQAIFNKSVRPTILPNMSWQVLSGQGRVRRTPNLLYDTPSSYTNGIVQYDEYFGFGGAIDRYDWKLAGKREMLIPYNNNKVFSGAGPALHKPEYFDPDYVRWELHRVWVVEAKVRPGARNVLDRRVFYIDEDDWTVKVTDGWDSAGNLMKLQYAFNANFPNLPGTIWQNSIVYNLETGQYASTSGGFADAPYNEPWKFTPVPASVFDPQSMAASAAY